MTYTQWEAMNKKREQEKQLVKDKIKEVEMWCKSHLLNTEGLVYNRIQVDLIDHDSFMIWQDVGFIRHKVIRLEKINVKPLRLEYLTSVIY